MTIAMNDLSNIIYKYVDSDEEEENEIGHIIKNYHKVSVNFAFKPMFKCPTCETENKVDKDFGSYCDKCSYYHNITQFRIMADDCINRFFETEEKNVISSDSEIYKIRINDDSYGTKYGVMLCTASWESNEWSSTPHNDFYRKFLLYDNEEDRNNAWSKYFHKLFLSDK